MKPLYQSHFHLFWDGVFIIISAILLVELPAYIYAPTDDFFLEYQLFLIPIIIIGIVVFYSLTLKSIIIYPSMIVFTRPLGVTKRKVSVLKNDITQVEVEPGNRPKLTLYHHSEELSILLYEFEIPQIKKAFASIDINIE